MTLRETVAQWHGGQLLIVCGCLAALAFAGVVGVRTLAERWADTEGDKSMIEYLTCMRAPFKHPERWPGQGARDETTPRVGYPLGCLGPTNYADRATARQAQRIVTGATWALALGVGAPALWMTWGWLGARARRQQGTP